MTPLAAELRRLRLALSPPLTQAQLAQTLGVTQSQVSDWEKGKPTPDAKSFKALAKALGTTVMHLRRFGQPYDPGAARTTERQRRGEPLLRGVRAYDLRHSFGTEWYRVTRDLKSTREVMRNTIRMTERYVEAAVSSVLLADVEAVAAALADTGRDTEAPSKAHERREKPRKTTAAAAGPARRK
jgi:transcriptional regulator with XRE-family HTH domain